MHSTSFWRAIDLGAVKLSSEAIYHNIQNFIKIWS